jgi:hypothetical protein
MTVISGSDWMAKLPAHGRHVMTADEATANAAAILTDKPSASAFLVQVWRSGVDVTADAVVTLLDGTLTVADGAATYSVTAGDVVAWTTF